MSLVPYGLARRVFFSMDPEVAHEHMAERGIPCRRALFRVSVDKRRAKHHGIPI